MKTTDAIRPWRWALVPAMAGGVLLSGCAALAPGGLPLGTPIAEARRAVFGPAGEYALPGGGTRLEFGQGSFGKETYMLDFNASGILVTSNQVLTEANLATIAPGLPAADLRTRFGHPAHVFSVPWQRLHVWNYRFAGGDCVWFQVSISDAAQQVTEAGRGPDPACDGPNERH